MQKYKIVVYPNAVLTKKASPVKPVGSAERKLISNMIDVMYREGGVGIAAPQVGVSTRIFIACPNAKRGEEIIFVNPVILKTFGEQIGLEDCLSLPGVSGEVRRAKKIEYERTDGNGNVVQETASDFLARIIQHEIDHLDGKLLIDRVDFDQRQELLSNYQRL